MTIREFATRNGFKKLDGLKVRGFDKEVIIKINIKDLDINPKHHFRLVSTNGWVYPNDLIVTTQNR